MSFFIDALLIAICIITVIVGTKRGFVKTLMSLVSTVIAFICSYTFTPALAEFLQNKFFLAPVADSIAKTIRSLVPATDGQFDIGLLFEDMPQTLSSILERYNIDPAALQNTAETVSGQGGDAVQAMADAIGTPHCEHRFRRSCFSGYFYNRFGRACNCHRDNQFDFQAAGSEERKHAARLSYERCDSRYYTVCLQFSRVITGDFARLDFPAAVR